MKTELQPYTRPNLPQKQVSVPNLKETSSKKVAAVPEEKKEISKDTKVDISAEAKALTPPIPTPATPKVDPKAELKTEAAKKVLKSDEKKPSELIKSPAIFFVKGMDIFSQYGGMSKMGEAIKGARVYGWDQKDEMIEQIKKTHPSQPVVLVGHSLGGDTVHEIAEELDTLDEKFRRVDLLVTIDAVGSSHDVVPQNVKKHLNIFSEESFFSDGPHVARNNETTTVENVLSNHSHTELDDAKAIQYQILNALKDVLPQT